MLLQSKRVFSSLTMKKQKYTAFCPVPQWKYSSILLTFFFWPGESSGFPNTQTKGPVSEAESVSIHLCWAQQASWQGNTSGEGQQSTLWVCWRQWHNSNSCREHASSFLNLLSHCTSQACGRLTPKPGMELELWESTSNQQRLDTGFMISGLNNERHGWFKWVKCSCFSCYFIR